MFTITIKIDRMVAVDTHVNGRNEAKVSAQVVSGYHRDHLHFFPKDWPNKEMMERFFSVDRVGKTYRIKGEEYSYIRNNGTKGNGVKIIAFV